MAETTSNHLSYLLGRYLSEEATVAEMEELTVLLQSDENAEAARTLLLNNTSSNRNMIAGNSSEVDRMIKRIIRVHIANAKVIKISGTWMRYAAAVLFLLAAGASFWLFRKPGRQMTVVTSKQDIAPGGDRAILTLADGSSILLDSAANGSLAQQGPTHIIKLTNGQLSYSMNATTGAAPENLYNTLTTPKGGQYQILLPDSSKVWLNAASSLRFPTAFRGTERHVELNGEAYFEIKEDKSMPFIVSSDGMKVQVLGTHFNINGYHDEPVIKTTLLTGSIKLFQGDQEQIIKPGQQVDIVKGDNKINVIPNADIEEALAWKNGYFVMKGADIPTIMRQISRWYDVEIRYKGSIPENRLGGRLPRNVNVSQILKIFELYNIHSSIDGKRITINPDGRE